MWLMLQRETPQDSVIATGVQHSVRDLVRIAFDEAGLDWREHVDVDPGLLRPADIARLVGDASKARVELGWEPHVSFDELVRSMTRSDLDRLARQRD
jgi:GDPmannose 4,6-dehydratase